MLSSLGGAYATNAVALASRSRRRLPASRILMARVRGLPTLDRPAEVLVSRRPPSAVTVAVDPRQCIESAGAVRSRHARDCSFARRVSLKGSLAGVASRVQNRGREAGPPAGRPGSNLRDPGSSRKGVELVARHRRGPARSLPAAGQAVASWWRWSLSRLCVAASSRHSDLTAERPRRRNRFAPRLALICPKTGSTIAWRCR